MEKRMKYEQPKLVDLTAKDWENPFRVGYGESPLIQEGNCKYGGWPSTGLCDIGQFPQ